MPISPQPTTPRVPLWKVILGVFLGLGVLFLVGAVVAARHTGRALAREESADGYVVSLTVRRDADGQEYYYPVVEFLLPDRSTMTVQLAQGSWPAAFREGEEVTVRYDPDKPTDARIDTDANAVARWILPTILGLLGLGFVVIPLLVGRVLMRDA